MKTANLLPSHFFVLCKSACERAVLLLKRKSHKPEVEGSSPSLTTTLKKQSQNTLLTVYTAFVGFGISLFLIKNIVQLLSHYFPFFSKSVDFVDFYCKVTANFLALNSDPYYNHYFPPF